MTQMEILEELKRLTVAERLQIIENALQLIREDLQAVESLPTQSQLRLRLQEASTKAASRAAHLSDAEVDRMIERARREVADPRRYV